MPGQAKKSVLPGDILFSEIRPANGRWALVREPSDDFIVSTKLMVIRANPDLAVPDFLYLFLTSIQTTRWLQTLAESRSGTFPQITFDQVSALRVPLPSLEEQRAISATIGALDDKIESTRRVRDLLRSLGSARLVAAVANSSTRNIPLGELTTSIARGVAPKYSDDDPGAPLVLNQKCVRDGSVTTSQARRMFNRDVAPHKRVTDGDILVNSTGTGTLGRVGRWHAGSIYADGHVSIVKVDRKIADPTVVAYSLFGREADIEALATGSTGQTELSPARLSALMIQLPDRESSAELESTLFALEDRIDGLRAEEELLSNLRDALLPELLSGRMRVPEVEAVLA